MSTNNSKIKTRLIALQRYILWHYWPSLQNIYVSEFPKSGGTWLSQMIASAAGLPFPRNSFVKSQPVILHSHHLPKLKGEKSIVIIRDGRDVMVSAYHHFIIPNDHCPRFEQDLWRKWMNTDNIENVKANLSRFIQVFHDQYKAGGNHINWSNHVENSCSTNNDFITYEQLRSSPIDMMSSVLNILGINQSTDLESVVDQYSFEKLKKENKNSTFLRKGIVGDWKNYFDQKSGKLFHQYAGETLIKYGYAKSEEWYEQL